MLLNSDFKELLSTFNEAGIRYLVVGGWAVMKYSEPRYTKDIDLWISCDIENARLVYTALKEFGAPLMKLTAEDFTDRTCFYQMGVPPVRIDILTTVPGVEFEECWSRRSEGDFGAVIAPMISKADLIVAKRAAGRPQDLIDLESLNVSDDSST